MTPATPNSDPGRTAARPRTGFPAAPALAEILQSRAHN
jgi:hypothetical protein